MKRSEQQPEPNEPEDFPLERLVLLACENPVWLLLLLLGLGLLPVFVTILLSFFSDLKNWRVLDPNEIGDTFGFLNALMSSLAFIGVLATLWMQRKELKIQQQIMKDNHKEMEKSAAALAMSEKRLAATTALTALESLRRSLEMKKPNGDGAFLQLKRKKVHLLIEGILEDVLVEHKDPIKTAQIKLADEINSLIRKVDSETNRFNAALISEIQEKITEWRNYDLGANITTSINDLELSIKKYIQQWILDTNIRKPTLRDSIAPLRKVFSEVVESVPSSNDFSTTEQVDLTL